MIQADIAAMPRASDDAELQHNDGHRPNAREQSYPTPPGLTTSEYRPDIDGLRGVAVAAVIINHAFPALFPGGFIGVSLRTKVHQPGSFKRDWRRQREYVIGLRKLASSTRQWRHS